MHIHVPWTKQPHATFRIHAYSTAGLGSRACLSYCWQAQGQYGYNSCSGNPNRAFKTSVLTSKYWQERFCQACCFHFSPIELHTHSALQCLKAPDLHPDGRAPAKRQLLADMAIPASDLLNIQAPHIPAILCRHGYVSLSPWASQAPALSC